MTDDDNHRLQFKTQYKRAIIKLKRAVMKEKTASRRKVFENANVCAIFGTHFK